MDMSRQDVVRINNKNHRFYSYNNIYVESTLVTRDIPELQLEYKFCGEGGIRTRGTLQYTRFPSVLDRPL